MSDALASARSTTLPVPDGAIRERHPAGATLFAPGPAEDLYRVQEGLVRLHVMDDEGEGFTLRYAKPGDWFGEEVLADLPRTVFAEAVTEVVVERVHRDRLGRAARAEIAEALASALYGLSRGMQRMAQRNLVARVAAELLELRDSALAVEEDDRTVVRITHDALAMSIGSVRETVTKAIGELARAGAVHAGYRRVALVDEARLADVADGFELSEARPAA